MLPPALFGAIVHEVVVCVELSNRSKDSRCESGDHDRSLTPWFSWPSLGCNVWALVSEPPVSPATAIPPLAWRYGASSRPLRSHEGEGLTVRTHLRVETGTDFGNWAAGKRDPEDLITSGIGRADASDRR